MAQDTMQNNAPQQDVSEQHRIRLGKLQAMQEAGTDPFVLTKYDCLLYTSPSPRDI